MPEAPIRSAALHSARSGGAHTLGQGQGGAVTVLVSLANMLGYAENLASLTQARGCYDSRFAFYRAAPRGGRDDPPPAAEAALRA